MPAWITSLLREDVAVPIPSAASRMITSRPAWASRRATARPITPVPITTHSTLSIRSSDSGLWPHGGVRRRSEEHTSELQSQFHLVCRLLLEKKKQTTLPFSIHQTKQIQNNT